MDSFYQFWVLFLNWIWSLFFTVSNKETNKVVKTKPYEYKYLEKYDELKNKEDRENTPVDKLKNSYIIDYTPYGNVVLKYDDGEKMFLYYCDKQAIPFKYLETLSRKFVIDNKCFDIYVDIRDELRENKYDIDVVDLKKGELADGEKDKRMKKVFATLKKKAGPGSEKNNKKVVLKENVNKYKFMGKFNDFSILESSHVKYSNKCLHVNEPIEINFATFKETVCH